MITSNTSFLALIGNPVSHSLSPIIQNAAIEYLGLDMISGDVDCGHDIGMSFQHSIQVLENGNIVTLDNGNLSQQINETPFPTSRALEIQIDELNNSCENDKKK